MKKTFLTIAYITLNSFTFAQAIGYGQFQKVFMSWKQSKWISIRGINNPLPAFSSKWKIKSFAPNLNGYFESYIWYNINAKEDKTALLLIIEEANESNKFTLKYIRS